MNDKSGAVDVVVIGGGPGGYVAAIRAAQLGGKVVIVEKDKLGGTCLNRGCIPTKALLKATDYLLVPREAAKMGVNLRLDGYDTSKLKEYKNRVVSQLVGGVQYLVRKNNISLLEGTGRLVSPGIVEVTGPDGAVSRMKTHNIIIATGSSPAILPVPGSNLPGVINSDGALSMDLVPKKMLVIGGGAVGIEFSFIYSNLGVKVTLVEMLPQLLAQMDEDIVKIISKVMTDRGIKVLTGTHLERIEETAGGLAVLLSKSGVRTTVEVDRVLAAAGRTPNTGELGLENIGVKTERGRIVVDNRMQTSVDGIYAIGDAIGGVLLAHMASVEGIIAAENAMGKEKVIDYKAVPGCIYSSPELAGVGLTEKQARELGYKVLVGKFPFSANGKAVAIGAPTGMAKIVACEPYGEVLGVHIIGERATDLIAEAALALKLEATVDELMNTIHAHPTLSETIMEAAHAVYGRAIHSP